MLVCVDSKPRLMMVRGLRRTANTLEKVKRFIADVSVVGAPGYVPVDNGEVLTSTDSF